jgi:V8-like Glu-specific endopeptidase
VVAIYDGTSLCTGTLVDPGIVLTAAHCLANVQSPEQLRILHGDHTEMNTPLTATAFGMHPDFAPEGDYDIFDYGYVEFSGLDPVGELLLPINDQDEWDQAIGEGGAVTLVGYGEDPDAAGLMHGIGEKRQVVTFISKLTPLGFEFYAGGMNKDSCQGDSGGPALVKLVDGTWRLGGVTSRGSSPCGQGGYYGAPYPALGWLRDETGLDLCGPECPTCDCLAMAPPKEEGCRVAGRAPPLSSAALLLVLLSLRPTRRRSRGCASAAAGTPSPRGRGMDRTARAGR